MSQLDKSKNWGGKRPGSGQPKKDPTTTITFRYDAKKFDCIKTLFDTKDISTDLKIRLDCKYEAYLIFNKKILKK